MQQFFASANKRAKAQQQLGAHRGAGYAGGMVESRLYGSLPVALLLSLLLALALAGCAGTGRQPDPLAINQYNDIDKDCVQLRAEIYDANLRAGDALVQAQAIERRNVGFGLVIPFSLNMDFSGKERREARHYRQRRDHLRRLFEKFNCVGYLGF